MSRETSHLQWSVGLGAQRIWRQGNATSIKRLKQHLSDIDTLQLDAQNK
jgi:hypothetical protein